MSGNSTFERRIKQISFECGAMGFERGANTEITTSYDEDGCLEGGRVCVTDPKHLFFNQIVVIYCYVGDYFPPNLFEHGERFGRTNYHQFLVEKKLPIASKLPSITPIAVAAPSRGTV